MRTSRLARIPIMAVLTVLVLGACNAPAPEEIDPPAQNVDRIATLILAQTTGYLGSLKQFTVTTQITAEDILESGHIADVDVSTRVTVQRPNKVRSRRRGDLIDQDFYYDGKTLTLYNPTDRVYARVPAPVSLDATLHHVREELGLVVPAADLLYANAYPLLMEEVVHAEVVGKAVIGGVLCKHVLFVRPGVEFQVWVAAEGNPLPYKYVVTDTGTPERMRITTVMSDWDTNPTVSDDLFEFEAPEGAQAIDFLPLVTTGGSND